jgi:hypothetical protein
MRPLIIATPEHRRAFYTGLSQQQIDVDAVEWRGEVLWLDAAGALDRFTPDGVIDPAAFDNTVGALVRQAASTARPVCAYGEMVALLWQAGNLPGAVELEYLWNGLAQEVAFSLLCAYATRLMQPAEALDGFAEVCDAHSQVLGGAPVAPDAELSRRFPPSLAAPGRARRFVAEALKRWQRPELVDTAMLVVSELATNAVQHAHGDFTVSLQPTGATIVVNVCDPDPALPQPRRARVTVAGRRGLALLEATASRWGHRHVPAGKLISAELSSAGDDSALIHIR